MKKILAVANRDILSVFLDAMDFNYSVIDKNGYYLVQNNQMVSRISAGLVNAAKIDKKSWEHCQTVMKSGKKDIKEEEFKGRYFLSIKQPLFDAGRCIGIRVLSFDITERKKAEKALQEAKEKAEAASKAKTEFLENMRHDLRTPLSGMIGYADLIKRAKSKEKINRYASQLSSAGQALLNFLNEILEAVKVSTGEIPLLKKKFDLRSLCQEVMALYRTKAQQKKLQWTLHISDQIPPYVIGDPIRIRRILLELAGNALNFTSKGSVAIQVELEQPADENKKLVVRFSVKDTGLGMTEEQQQELFVRFKRFTPSYQGIYRGAGLGLSIIKQFLDELGGEIYVASQMEKGTTFTCLIPLQEALTESLVGVTSFRKMEKPAPDFFPIDLPKINLKTFQKKKGKSARLLLVEDNSLSAEVTSGLLNDLGYQIEVAKDGSSAIQLFQRHAYELILMDIGLPDRDGYEVTRQIRALEGKKEHPIPIIALSAHADPDECQLCVEAGMNAVLTKPLPREKAQEVLATYIPSHPLTFKTKKSEKEEIYCSPTGFEGMAQADSSSLEFPPGAREAGNNAENQNAKGMLKKFSEKQMPPLHGEVIDRQATKKIGLAEKTLQHLLPLMLRSLAEDIPKLQAAYEKKDMPMLSEVAHKTKGGAIYCGAIRLRNACSQLEMYVKEARNGAMLDSLYRSVVQESEAVKKEILKIMHQKESAA